MLLLLCTCQQPLAVVQCGMMWVVVGMCRVAHATAATLLVAAVSLQAPHYRDAARGTDHPADNGTAPLSSTAIRFLIRLVSPSSPVLQDVVEIMRQTLDGQAASPDALPLLDFTRASRDTRPLSHMLKLSAAGWLSA